MNLTYDYFDGLEPDGPNRTLTLLNYSGGIRFRACNIGKCCTRTLLNCSGGIQLVANVSIKSYIDKRLEELHKKSLPVQVSC